MPQSHDWVHTIAEDLRAIPEQTRKEVRRALRAAGEAVAADARSRASWSSRIPGTVRVEVSFRFGREGVTVRAGGKSAPHARPYEDVSGRGSFRHPVHADPRRTRAEWTWVSQTSRPFLFPAARSNEARTTASLRGVLDTVPRARGFGG